jgi:flagellar assembly protein FliH
MSLSSEAGVSEVSAPLHPADIPDLRTGDWTRLGGSHVLGDDVTENALGALADRARRAARAQGYAVGWAEGRREARARAVEDAEAAAELARRAEERREAEHRAVVEALVLAADELRAAVTEVCARVGEQATELALAVTEELVGRELSAAADPGADVVRRVLAVVPDGATPQVRLHPSVGASPALSHLADRGLVVVPDPTIEPHDAVVETDDTVIDLRIPAALDRLREVLR